MPNLFTRVPDEPPPNLPSRMRLVVYAADAFMFLMASRPKSGSLRNTWVTRGTLLLGAAVAVFASVLALSLLVHLILQPSGLLAFYTVLVLIFALGGASVTWVGVLQRRRAR